MHPVVMAAGEGRRLRPLTERWPKPLLPIDGKPVLGTLLHELAAGGFARATVVVGHLGDQIETFVGDGSAFGLEVRLAWQPEALGSADAVVRALEAGAEAPLLVTAADTVYTAGDLGRAAKAWTASGTAGGLGVRIATGPERTPVTVENGRLKLRGTRTVPSNAESQASNLRGRRVRLHLMEIDHGAFCREVELPEDVHHERINASYRDGLLWVELPKK